MASGALESIVIDGRLFQCKADDDAEILLPGFSNETVVGGGGSMHWKKTRHAGRLANVNLIANDKEDDLVFLQKVQDKMEAVPISFTKVDGTFYSGKMQLTDEIPLSSGENIIPITMEGQLERL